MMTRCFVVAAVVCSFCVLTNTAGAGRAQQRRPQQQRQQPSTAPSDRVFGARLTSTEGYHAAPAAAETADGTVYVAWVMYVEGQGDMVAVRGQFRSPQRSRATPTQILTPKPGQYIRPVIAATAAGEQLVCLWTETAESNRAAIWFSHFRDGKWSKAARLLPDEQKAHQNPEVTARSDGTIAAVYQVHNGKDYDIHLARFADGKWGEGKSISNGETNDWDAVAVFDAKGKLHVAWSAHAGGDYDVMHLRPDDANAKPRRISARGEYDMHPWLAAAPDGSVWLSWDVVRIKNHGYSGGTTITGANKEGEANHWSGIEVRVLDGDTVRIPGKPRQQIVAPQGYSLAHRALGKIAVSANGEPWMVYRALMKPIAPWSPNVRDGYLWEVMARPFRDGAWQAPKVFNDSDGYLEEPAVVSSKSGVKVAYTSEHRHSSARDVTYVTKKENAPPLASGGGAGATTQAIEAAYDHHKDFDGFMGWHGDVYLAPLPNLLPPALEQSSLPAEEKPADRKPDPRTAKAAGDHSVDVSGQTMQLLWGDLHRHSNVSRCSVGNEPNPEDLYRYGIDIDMYDFFGLSDHSEYSTDYYWWRQQKVADLYHIPGVLSILYNSEWSMQFPQGHTNTVFPTRHNVKIHGKQGATATLKGGWEMLARGGYKAITIPHTTADPGMGTTWPAYDPKYLRLVEIFQSCRGSYEHDGCPRQHANATNKEGFYWEALKKGYKAGIICSSDHGYGAAYACVYAPENTRDAVWQALYDRRTYGSTTYGLVLEVRTSDGHWMGEEWSSSDAPELNIYVRGSAPIRSVEIIGRTKVLHAEGSAKKPLDAAEHRIKWSDPEWSKQTGEQWYYVRVIQADDEMAWSSPVWVTPRR